jgi:4-hydroxy-tetrahydrodipicolinate synthase
MSRWEGVFPILLTTFEEDGSLDLKSQLQLVDYLLAAKAHGIALFGNASEGYTLSNAERVELMRKIIPHVRRRVPVIVSSGHTGTDCAAALSKEAQGLGADGLMILPPYYMKPDGAGLMHYYQVISNAVSIPIMVQDAPLMTQVAMPPALLARMAEQIEHVQYAKIEAAPTAVKVSEVRDAAGDKLTLFGGLNGQFFLEELNRGATGTMPGSDLIPQFVELWDAHRSGNADDARKIFRRILPLIRYELQPGLGVSAMKLNLKELGVVKTSAVRHPTRALDRKGVEELAELRAEVG